MCFFYQAALAQKTRALENSLAKESAAALKVLRETSAAQTEAKLLGLKEEARRSLEVEEVQARAEAAKVCPAFELVYVIVWLSREFGFRWGFKMQRHEVLLFMTGLLNCCRFAASLFISVTNRPWTLCPLNWMFNGKVA